MSRHAELPEESIAGHPGPANDPTLMHAELSASPAFAPDFDDMAAPARAPGRFGRLALWMASASALGIGVLGTVGYGMWFTHDQRVYAEAMTSARRTLGIEHPVTAVSQTQAAGIVQPLPPAPAPTFTASPIDTATLADNAPAADPTTASAPAASAQRKPVANRASRNGTQTAQNSASVRRHTAHPKSEPGLFARVGAFFHRVSYQHNGPTRQREEYSRP